MPVTAERLVREASLPTLQSSVFAAGWGSETVERCKLRMKVELANLRAQSIFWDSCLSDLTIEGLVGLGDSESQIEFRNLDPISREHYSAAYEASSFRGFECSTEIDQPDFD